MIQAPPEGLPAPEPALSPALVLLQGPPLSFRTELGGRLRKAAVPEGGLTMTTEPPPGRRSQYGQRPSTTPSPPKVWVCTLRFREEGRRGSGRLPFGPRSQASLQKAQGPGVCKLPKPPVQCRRCSSTPGSEGLLEEASQPTPVFLPGVPHGQSALELVGPGVVLDFSVGRARRSNHS